MTCSWLTSKRIYCIKPAPHFLLHTSALPGFTSHLFWSCIFFASPLFVTLCLSLTWDTCFDLVNSCSLWAFWGDLQDVRLRFSLGSLLSFSLLLALVLLIFFLLALHVSFLNHFIAHSQVSLLLLLSVSSPTICSPFSLLCRSLSSSSPSLCSISLRFSLPYISVSFFPDVCFSFLIPVICFAILFGQHCGFTEQNYDLSGKIGVWCNYTESYSSNKRCQCYFVTWMFDIQCQT